MKILNLVFFGNSKDFVSASVDDFNGSARLMRFNTLPDRPQIVNRAEDIADIAAQYDCEAVLIDPPNYMVSALEVALREAGLEPVYLFKTGKIVT